MNLERLHHVKIFYGMPVKMNIIRGQNRNVMPSKFIFAGLTHIEEWMHYFGTPEVYSHKITYILYLYNCEARLKLII